MVCKIFCHKMTIFSEGQLWYNVLNYVVTTNLCKLFYKFSGLGILKKKFDKRNLLVYILTQYQFLSVYQLFLSVPVKLLTLSRNSFTAISTCSCIIFNASVGTARRQFRGVASMLCYHYAECRSTLQHESTPCYSSLSAVPFATNISWAAISARRNIIWLLTFLLCSKIWLL